VEKPKSESPETELEKLEQVDSIEYVTNNPFEENYQQNLIKSSQPNLSNDNVSWLFSMQVKDTAKQSSNFDISQNINMMFYT